MTTLLAPFAQRAPDAAILHEIRREDCNLAIWERPSLPNFAPLVAGNPRDIRFETALAQVPEGLRHELAQNGFGAAALWPALIADAAILAQHFCAVLALARLELRLEVVTSDSCRKFHADYVRARLITTYAGPGTDWVDSADAERLARGAAPVAINRMKASDVGIFKGKLASQHPAIHRSPPISDTGEQRLLLVLNPVAAAPAL